MQSESLKSLRVGRSLRGALLLSCFCLLNSHAQTAITGELAQPTFSKPSAITNTYLPLSSMHKQVLKGIDDGKPTRIERIMKSETRTFTVDGRKVVASIMEDRTIVEGRIKEIALDYFAQSDDGAVCYLGEDVDNYKNGKVVDHSGSWLTGEHNAVPGIMIPAHPKVGYKFHSENVPGIAVEADEIVSIDETVKTPAGTYKHCVKVKEMVEGEKPEYKYYAPNIGVVREVPPGGDVRLISNK